MQLSPIFNLPAFTDANGEPLAGGKIFTYEAGSFSVLKATYAGQDGLVLNSNPIVLDSAGKLPSGVAIWLTDNELYNLVLTAPDGTTVLQSFDNVTGVTVPTGGIAGAGAVWVETPGATYLSGTQFLLPGNVTAQYAPGNRVRLTLSTGYAYATVSASAFSSPNTAITVVNDGAALNSSLSVAEYSILVTNGRTVDAGAVAYTPSLAYSAANTVGNALLGAVTAVASVGAKQARDSVVHITSGGDTYAINPTPAVTSYSADSSFLVQFAADSDGGSTLNINSVGAKALKQYDATGARQDAVIKAGMISEVVFDTANDVFVVVDALPPVAPAAPVTPRGYQQFLSNGTFTVPAGVSFIKVTCVGGGGGGGSSSVVIVPGESSTTYYGSGGGGGCVAWKYISTTAGTEYAVAVGAAGLAAVSEGTTGGAGGTSSFGVSLVSASGGAGGGGGSDTGSVGGAGGGVASEGSVIIRGANGQSGTSQAPGQGGWAPGWGAPGREWGGAGAGGAAGVQGTVVVEW